MTSIGSQLTFCSPQRILRRTVVVRNEQNVVKQFFSLDDNLVESAQTLFFDGILSSEIVSLKQHVSSDEISELTREYEYIDLSDEFPNLKISKNQKNLLLDFGTNTTAEINSKLAKLAQQNSGLSIFDVIASCVYYPALLIGANAELTVDRSHNLLLWENVDLVNKGFTVNTKIREI